MYCQYPVSTLKFLSPVLNKDSYTLSVSVIGERWYWVEKSGRRTGSKGNVVSLDKIFVNERQWKSWRMQTKTGTNKRKNKK
jgi:hypothetical protein